MAARRPTAKFRVAYLLPANSVVTTGSSQSGSRFDCTTLSMTTLIGHGWRTSATVSPTTATSARVSAFQCGRSRRRMRTARLGERARRNLHQLVVGIDVIHILGRHELVLDEHRG